MQELTAIQWQLQPPDTSTMDTDQLTQVVLEQHQVIVAILEDLTTIKEAIEAI